MDIIKTHNQTIEKALKNEVLSENISEILELEEIIYLNRLKLTMNCFSIEATLSRFLDEFPNVSEDYKEHINSINKQENDMKIKIDVTLCNALKSMPEEIKSFISLFLIENLYQNNRIIKEKAESIKHNPNCTDFINAIEKHLGFDDAFVKLNVLRYVKRKFSHFQDYYYIDLINTYTSTTLIGLLYAIQDKFSFCLTEQ